MLKEYVRNYAKELGLDDELCAEIADSNQDEGLYTLSLNDLFLCTFSQIEVEAKPCVLAVIALGAFESGEFLSYAQKLCATLPKYNFGKGKAVATVADEDENLLGLYAILPLEQIEQSDFNVFVDNLARFVKAINDSSYGKSVGSSALPQEQLLANEKLIDDFLAQAGLTREFLSENLNTLFLDDKQGVNILRDPGNCGVILSSIIGSQLEIGLIKDLLKSNTVFKCRHYFSVGATFITFNTPISARESVEDFYEKLSAHTALSSEFADFCARRKNDVEAEGQLFETSQMLMV